MVKVNFILEFERRFKMEIKFKSVDVNNAMKNAIKDYENIDSLNPRRYLRCYTKEDVTEILETYICDCFLDMLDERELMEVANSPYKNTRELAKMKLCSLSEKGVTCKECYKNKKAKLRREGIQLDSIERKFRGSKRCRAIQRMLEKRALHESKRG